AVVSADLSLEDGTLSGLMLGTLDVTPGVGRDMLAGGALAAAFSLRDEALPRAQAELDALALGLSQRLQGADPTAPPGLFTDAGGPVDPAASVGLAGRLTLNAAVDPASGGALWRLRDGVGAAMPGPAGNPALPDAILSSLRQVLPPPAATPDATPRSLAGAGAALSAAWSARAEAAAQTAAYARAGAEALGVQDAEARGVDTDREMQSLLLIERAYQANAQVVRTLDDLMEDLIGMLR
ncbi:MAG: flagellar basal body rod C-terminal domain-containing protein, partial [Rubricella sp.]